MQSVSVAVAKDKLPFYLHLAEQGETIEITRHGKPIAVISKALDSSETISGFELAYQKFRTQMNDLPPFSEDDWKNYFEIPRTIQRGLRHEEDFE